MNGYRSRSSPGRITMTANDLQRIEAALGRPLPAAVTRFFLNYPPELRSTVREIGGPDEDGEGDPYTECAADAELSDNPDRIIEMNSRQSGWDADFPDNMLIVGGGESGETYWVDLDDQRGPVYRFEAGTEPEHSDQLWESLEEFARGLIESYRSG
jgi:hypothetical protein